MAAWLFSFVFTGTGRGPMLVGFGVVFIWILVSAAYYRHVLADLAVEIENC